ncbi:spermatogenesis-associated protein 48 [Chanos chanos]|uniref:Spermatogenesis-associated protein 48 n=1 Tax=Chanos chanos TaxID=29144 RepID=A0A6J2V5B8_CHACN|nr:spermatogenesis-associated protein 48 [Chanos chanos]
MNLLSHRGPEGRYDFESLISRDNPAFAKFNPQACPPADHAPLAPLRDEVPVIDPCSGHLSIGAELDLGIKGRHKFIDRFYAPSDLWVPAGFRDRPQTPPVRPSAVTSDLAEHKKWNSKELSDTALRAHLGGWTSAKKVTPASPKIPGTLKFYSFFPDRNVSLSGARSAIPTDWIKKATCRYIYTSTAQRSYEDVSWDSKLPERIKPPETTLEKMADPVNQRFTLRRYHPRTAVWQTVGTHWNRQQLRAKHEVRKPITFTSPCTRSGQIPSYCGVVGSENMDSIDRPEQEFTPLTVLRSTVPPYTPTAHRSTIPGYAGKAPYDRPYSFDSNLPGLPCSPQTTQQSQSVWSSSAYGRMAPLSRMVTTVLPYNPYLLPKVQPHTPHSRDRVSSRSTTQRAH